MDLSGISLSERNGQVYLHCEPAPARAPVCAAALQGLLEKAGFGEWQLDEPALAAAVADCNDPSGGMFEHLLAERCDARIELQLAPDAMTATLSLTPARGGQPATVELVLQALAAAGVVAGIDQAAVRQACALGRCSALVVAAGVLPQHGRDTDFEALIPQAPDRVPQLNADGLIDYREHGEIVVVPADAPLMRRTPSTRGMDGHDIRARVLAARPGREEPFAPGLDGAAVSGADPNLLLATVSGQPVRVHCGVMVEPILRLDEVNMASGNIHFDGTVHVAGDVVQGMKVQASGDIVVDGTVDGGLLQAGGNIQVNGGVIANARLRAGGSVSARFAQGVQIEAGTVIMLDDMALECELKSLNQIIIGAKSPQRGRLVGGSATTMMLISAPLLGSSKAGLTQVVLGANAELEARYAALQQRIEKEEATEANLGKLVKQLSTAGDPKGLLERVKASRQHAGQMWGAALVERGELEKELALARSARLEVGVALTGAVDLSLGRLTARLRRDFDAGSFGLDEAGNLAFTDAAGRVGPAA